MMPAPFPNWGERSWLHDKSLQYVMSMDLLYRLPVSPDAVAGTSMRLPLVAVPPDGEPVSTYRTVGPMLFRGIDSIEREVPQARVIHGMDSLELKEEGAVDLDGRLRLEIDTVDAISISYTGKLELRGGTLQLASPNPAGARPALPSGGRPRSPKAPESYDERIVGTAFISTRQEVAIPRYRWLTYNQLVGVGRAAALVPLDPDPWLITLTFDLYLGL
jgi:uncharacterized protein DUF3237